MITAEIKSSKLSNTSSILWIEVQDIETVESILRQSAYFKREAKAIMYPPQELFQTIKSIENNYKEKKKSNPELCYQVKLGQDNIELWTKLLREPQYTKQELTTYGPIIEPVIDTITTLPNFGQSPPKGQTFKRLRDSPDHSIITPKRHQYLSEEISLVPGWQTPNTPPFKSTLPSPPKESPQTIPLQIMKQMTKPTTP